MPDGTVVPGKAGDPERRRVFEAEAGAVGEGERKGKL